MDPTMLLLVFFQVNNRFQPWAELLRGAIAPLYFLYIGILLLNYLDRIENFTYISYFAPPPPF